jgi:transcriptional regulator with XRE-family HTH domain
MAKHKQKPPDLADQLRRLIAGCGLSLNRLAKATGVHQAQLSRFMRGERSLTLPAAGRICGYLGVRLTEPAHDKRG